MLDALNRAREAATIVILAKMLVDPGGPIGEILEPFFHLTLKGVCMLIDMDE